MTNATIVVPDVGSEAEVEVIEVLVSQGDEIALDDAIVVLESDKASIEVPATVGGTVTDILVKVGDKVKQDDVLVNLASNGESDTSRSDDSSEPVAPESQSKDTKEDTGTAETSRQTEALSQTGSSGQSSILELRVPDIGGAENVEVIELSVEQGEHVEKDDAVVVLESDKASMDIPSPHGGKIIEFAVAIGGKVNEGDLLARIEVSSNFDNVSDSALPETEETDAPSLATSPAKVNQASEVSSTTPLPNEAVQRENNIERQSTVHAGPAVRKLARELGVNLERVKATGPRSRIQKDDLHAYIKAQVQAAQEGNVAGVTSAPVLPDFAQFGEIETRRLEKLQVLTARNMQSSWTNVPHVTQFDEADITELEVFRKSKRAAAESRGVKLTPVSFLIKACAHALSVYPQFNVSLDIPNNKLIQKKYFHIGVAVDTDYGLVVPVIRDVMSKDLWQISDELGSLASKAKARKLMPQDMQGACFTISSLGGIGGTAFTPIVNQPEVAILGVSKAQKKPVFIDGAFVPRLMLPLSLSYDHRAINGADAARFTTQLAKYLSDIRELLF